MRKQFPRDHNEGAIRLWHDEHGHALRQMLGQHNGGQKGPGMRRGGGVGKSLVVKKSNGLRWGSIKRSKVDNAPREHRRGWRRDSGQGGNLRQRETVRVS